MKKTLVITFLLISQLTLTFAQSSRLDNFDSFVVQAISLSEEALYDARLQEARQIVQTSYFENCSAYSQKHEMMLTIQDIRVQRFMRILYQMETNHIDNFNRLNSLFPYVQKMNDKNVQGKYLWAFSSAHRSIGNLDSASIYEEKALKLFNEIGNLGKVAEIKASQISRTHNIFLKEGKKEEILALIPEYEKEIKFSALHSKYALAYHTRHLAQIHRRQTFNYQASLSLFKTSLLLREEIGFKPFIPASYSSLGDVYAKMEQYDSAIEMYNKSVALADSIGFIRYQSYPILSIGNIYLSQGNQSKAKEFYLTALQIAFHNNYLSGIDEALQKITQLNNDFPDLQLTETLLKISKEFRLAGLLDQAKEMLESVIVLISSLENQDSLMVILKIELAEVLLRKSFHFKQVDSTALLLYTEALDIALKLGNKKLIGDAIYGLGYYNFKLGAETWDTALLKLDESLKHREIVNDVFGLSRSHFIIGVIYQRSKELEKAEKQFDLSINYARLAGSKYMEGENQRHIGYLYYQRNDLLNAIPYFQNSLELRKEIGYVDGAIFASITLGQTYAKLNKNTLAIRYLEQGLKDALKINSKVGMIRAYWALSKIYFEQEEYTKASQMIQKTIETAKTIDDTSTEEQARLFLKKIEQ